MSNLRDRGDAFESKFAHDAEMQFKVESRRNRLLGMWAAGLLEKHGEEAVEYAREVIKSDFEEAGHEDVVRKLKSDLEGKVTEATIREQLEMMTLEAKRQLLEEG